MPAMHEVDHKIFGDDMQFVEVELDPGEAAVAEAGGMFYMEDGISMETVFGDGSQQLSRRVETDDGVRARRHDRSQLSRHVLLAGPPLRSVPRRLGRRGAVSAVERHE